MPPIRLGRIPFLRAFMPRIRVPVLPLARPASTLTRQPSTSPTRTRLLRIDPQLPRSRAFSSRSPSPSSPTSDPSAATLSGRLKLLIKSYGWYALGVYLILGAVDFGVAFAAINILGAEQVSKVTSYVKEHITQLLHPSGTSPDAPMEAEMDKVHQTATMAANGGSESLYAMLVLAYTVHKTLFLPVRVGLTAALTPRIVKWLSARGWAGSAGAKRAAHEVREKMKRTREGPSRSSD